MPRCACDTRPGRPSGRVARGAIAAAAGPRCNPGTDDRRNWGRSARTRRYSRRQRGRPRCGPAGAGRMPSCHDQADRQAELSCPSPAPCAATGHGNRAGAVRGRQPDRHPAGYRSRCQGSGDCSLSSPPGGSSCRHRGLEQRCPLSPRYPQALRSECPAELNATGGGPGPCPLHARWGGPARELAVTHETSTKTMTSVVPGPVIALMSAGERGTERVRA